MWILKNSNQLLENLQSQSSHINRFRTFDFSTLYTTVPHDKLKSRLCNIIRHAFRSKNGKKWYEYIVVGYNSTYFVEDHSNEKHKYTENDIVSMIVFVIDTGNHSTTSFAAVTKTTPTNEPPSTPIQKTTTASTQMSQMSLLYTSHRKTKATHA